MYKDKKCQMHLVKGVFYYLGIMIALLNTQAVNAVDIKTGNSDLGVRWDNTLKYSGLYRVSGQDAALLTDVNLDDGNRNFDKGIVSNRIDVLSELDISYKKRMGLRLSAAGWYDAEYVGSNDNDSAGTNNSYSVASNKFTDETEELMGKDIELLDAFGYTEFKLATKPTVLRVGRHSLLYGETLFFGSNGIAGTQAPTDLNKLLSVPGSQFKEIIRPVGQASFQTQINSKLTIGGYYQFEWEETKIPAAGSYLSAADYVGEGAERLLLGGGNSLYHGADIEGDDQGQGGVQIRMRPGKGDWEYGLYLTHFHDKTPYLYFLFDGTAGGPAFAGDTRLGQYKQVYAENITSFGGSASGLLGNINVAAEASVRWNQPLVSDPQTATAAADNDDNELFARGKSLHLNVSAIGFLSKGALWDGGSWLAEIAHNRRLAVDKNRSAIDPATTHSATAVRGILTLNYFQVLPNMDVSVPIGVGYNLDGRSSVLFNWNGGVEHGGDFSIGADARYKQVWLLSARYVNYFGNTNTFLTPPNSATPVLSFGQALQDRDFISLSLQRTF